MEQIIKSLELLYGENYATHKQRYERLTDQFINAFADTELHYFSTPGRTEIGGNHTDHNHGKVLAASINLDSIAVAGKNETNHVVLYSEGYKQPFDVDLSTLDPIGTEAGTTASLVRGIAAHLRKKGYKTGGFNMCMSSDVLPGSGLSSSASVEVLIGTVFNALYNNGEIAEQEIAKTGQYAENVYFGKPCGLMDQMACAVGGIIAIDFADPQKPVVEKVNFDFSAQNYSLIVVDTGGNHADLTADYAAIPAEMKSVATVLGGNVLRDLESNTLFKDIFSLRQKTGDRAVLRAFHFFKENERVTQQVNELKNGNFSKFLKLVSESGDSSFKWLQNIFTTGNIQEQGITLALAVTENYLNGIAAGASRVHGGGFAGTIQVFLPNDHIENYVKIIDQTLGENRVKVLKIRPSGTVYLNVLV